MCLQYTAPWEIEYDCWGRLMVLAYLGYYAYQGLSFLLFFMAIGAMVFYQLKWLKK